jgi:hypothetical protein
MIYTDVSEEPSASTFGVTQCKKFQYIVFSKLLVVSGRIAIGIIGTETNRLDSSD